jgi:hypothetical protein
MSSGKKPWEKELEKLGEDMKKARDEFLKEEAERVKRNSVKKPIKIPETEPPENHYELISDSRGPIRLRTSTEETQIEIDLKKEIEDEYNKGNRDPSAIYDAICMRHREYIDKLPLDKIFELQKIINDYVEEREKYGR